MKHQCIFIKKVTGFLSMVNFILESYVLIKWIAKNNIVQEF